MRRFTVSLEAEEYNRLKKLADRHRPRLSLQYDLARRTQQLMSVGFRNFDAFHLACAEFANADVLVTADDRFLALGRRHAELVAVRVIDVVTLAQEVIQ